MDICHYTFIQTHIECITLRVNSNINRGLYVIVMCQHRFISCNQHNFLVENVDNEGSYACVGSRVYRKSLYLPLSFSVTLKLL